jgi:hypothetical protein
MVLESVPDLGVGLVVESGFEASPHFEEGDGVCELVAQHNGAADDGASQLRHSELTVARSTGVVPIDSSHVHEYVSPPWLASYISFLRVGKGKHVAQTVLTLRCQMGKLSEMKADSVGVNLQPVKCFLFSLRAQMLA